MKKIPCLALGLLLTASTAFAADRTWTNGADDALWSSVGNWDSGVPVAGDSVIFNSVSSGTVHSTVTLDSDYPDSGTAISRITFNYGADLTLYSAGTYELYTNGITVSDAYTYTLDIAKNSQGNSGFMPQVGATLNVGTGGTLLIKTAFGAKSGVSSGNYVKTGAGTLSIGDGVSGNAITQYLQLKAEGGITELGFTSGYAANGISGISAGATVKITANNEYLTTLSSSGLSYQSGVSNVAGTYDLNGYNQTIYSLSGTSTGVVTNSGNNDARLRIGVASLSTKRNENDGDFKGTIQDGSLGNLSLVVNAYKSTYKLTLSGANTYTGGTTISSGTLVADSVSALGAGEVAIESNGVLKLGNTAGVELSGITTLTSSGTIVLTDTDSRILLAGYDFSGGTVLNLNGKFDVTGSYYLFTTDGATNLAGNGDGSVTFLNETAGLTYSFSEGVLTVVPEPSTYALMGAIGAVGLVMLRRRKK
ncbi:MAG: autotransporter-associated beta strand repeat-containing protein [Puniceicoccales bacterium]|jgi:autotransporter-associated beta strand protein|nr:autotransporter-associated beta strand repeat-containing protein [Puniceicoccales bacterium]